MSNLRREPLEIVALALALVVLLSGCGGEKADAGKGGKPNGRGPAGPASVKLATVGQRDIRETLEYTADIAAMDEARVFSRVPGKVLEKVVDEGAVVRKGDVIAYVDRDEVGLKFEKAPVESPLEGVIGRVYVDRGASVTVQSPIALVVDIRSVRAKMDIPERYVSYLGTNLASWVTVDAWPGVVFTGRVWKVSPVVDSDTRTMPVEVLIANADGKLKPGMFCRVALPIKERKSVTVVPREAVLGRGSESVVYVVTNGVARMRSVTMGLRDGGDVEVSGPIAPGDSIVVMGHQRLKDGSTVLMDDGAGGGGPRGEASGARRPGKGSKP